MAKLTLTDLTSGYDSTSRINANNTLIEAAFENTLSRDGTEPNTMSSEIDMNSHRILNLGTPIQLDDAVRLRDLSNLMIPSGAISLGQAVGSIGLTAVTGVSALVARADSLPPLSQAIVPTWTGLHTFSAGWRTSDGTVAAPSWSFASETGTGAYRVSAGVWGFATLGVVRYTVAAAGLTMSVPVILQAGTAAAPSLTLAGDTNTGGYSAGADDFGFTAGGARVGGFRTAANGGVHTVDTAGTLYSVGYKQIPQNSQSGNYTAVRADESKHLYHPSGAGASHTYTIPANASVAYPIGTVLTVVNRDSNTLSIAITTDTMYLANSASTGTRTLASNGVATILKTGTTEWMISGAGVT